MTSAANIGATTMGTGGDGSPPTFDLEGTNKLSVPLNFSALTPVTPLTMDAGRAI